MMDQHHRKPRKFKIWIVITFWMAVSFFVVGFSYLTVMNFLQYRTAKEKAYDYVRNNVEDVSADINDMASAAMLNIIERMYTIDLITTANTDDPDVISDKLRNYHNVDGMVVNLINADGVVIASSDPDQVGKDIHDNPDDKDFLAVLDGTIYAGFQAPRPSEEDASVMMHYVAARLPDDSGIVQVGLRDDLFHKLMIERAQFAVTNRRIGENGYLLVSNSDHVIINSYHNDDSLKTLSEAGITIDPDQKYSYVEEAITVFGEPSFVCINEVQGVYIIGVYPVKEAEDSMEAVMQNSALLGVTVFVILFAVVGILIRSIIVHNMIKVNRSLQKITEGDLEEKVEVRRTDEFDQLSTDINQTVDRLKGYISEAAARIDEDLENAKTIQSASLPSVFPPFPEHREFEIYATMTAAKEVGGDFYDFFMISPETLGFLIADVSGKGIPGAMFMMRSKSTIRTIAQSGLSPAEAFTAANERLCEGNDSEMFVTAWMGYLNFHTGELRLANAGHNRPVLIHNGRAKYMNTRAELMLAGMEGTEYTEQKVMLKPGDILFLYTDGVTEAMDAGLNQYGERRLQQLLSFRDQVPEPDPVNGLPGAVCQLVAHDVEDFVRGAEQSDDLTMLCIRYLGDEIYEKC